MIFFFFIDQFLKFFFKNYFTLNFEIIDSFSEISSRENVCVFFFSFIKLIIVKKKLILLYLENYSFALNFFDFLFFFLKEFFFFFSFFFFLFFFFFFKKYPFSFLFFFGFLSNGLDRIINKFVIDYISINLDLYYIIFFLPVFNIADLILATYSLILFHFCFIKKNMLS